MKKHYLFALALFPLCAFGQLKQIVFSELTSGSGMFFGAEMSTTTITVTVQGPADRFLAFGFGTGMANGNDALIWSTLGSGAAPLQVRDHRMIGSGVEPSVDAQQDWTVISNNVSGGNRTIVASRALNTGDANDVTFNFAATTQNLFWAKGPSASNQLQYHGGNRASGIVRNWVLVDQTPPTLSSTTPADNASGVSLSSNLTLSFNEPVSWGTGSITLYDENNNVVQTVSSGAPQVTFFGNNAIFNPTANLLPNMDYYVHVDPTALKDAGNNFFAGFADNTTWNFNTNDITAPVLIASPFVPADNAVAVSVSTNLVVSFNEAVQLGTGLIELFDGSGLVESFDVATSPAVTVSGVAVTINPASDLAMNTDYYVHIAAGAIEDLSGNDYAGISNNTTWNFNTNDIVAPTAVSPFDPADNATGVATTGVFTIMFSEDVMLNAVGALELRSGAGTLVESFNGASSGLVVNGDELQITTTNPLNEVTDYYITIAGGLISDLAGNAFAGFTDNTTWNFSTGDFTEPQPFSLSPADNATAVPVMTVLTLTFNEDVMFGAAGSIFLTDDTDFDVVEFDVTSSTDISITGAALTITPPAALDMMHAYHVTINSGAITDLSGNPFAGISNGAIWNFVTDGDSGIDELTKAGVSWNGSVLSIDSQSPFTANLYEASGKLVRENMAAQTDLSGFKTGTYLVTVVRNTTTQTVRIYVR